MIFESDAGNTSGAYLPGTEEERIKHKMKRKVLKGLRKWKDDKRKEKEGVNYASGRF